MRQRVDATVLSLLRRGELAQARLRASLERVSLA